MIAVLAYLLVRRRRSFSAAASGLTDWSKIRYFSLSEFDSNDVDGSGVGTGKMMKEGFVLLLDELRDRLGQPIQINSGYRTLQHNAWLRTMGANAAVNSAHLKGLAADIHCPDLDYMKRLCDLARDLGFVRIGQYDNGNSLFVHLDLDPTKGYQGEWYYRNGHEVSNPLI